MVVASAVTADELMPLVEALPLEERLRLMRLIALRSGTGVEDMLAYLAHPPGPDELDSDEEQLAWESDGWEDLGVAQE